MQDAAAGFARQLEGVYGKYMVGPAEPVINRVRNLFLMDLLFKLPKDASLIGQCKKDIGRQCAVLHAEKRFRNVTVLPDVDPQ